MSELPEPTPAELERVAALLGALGDEPLPPAVATRLSAALDAELGPAPAPAARRRRRPLGVWLPRLVVPVAAAAVIGTIVVVNRDAATDQASEKAPAAAAVAPEDAGASAAPEASADAALDAAPAAGAEASAAGAQESAAAATEAPATEAAPAAASSEAAAATSAAAADDDALATRVASALDAAPPFPGATLAPDQRAPADGAIVQAYLVPPGTTADAVLAHYGAALSAAGWGRADPTVGVPGVASWALDGTIILLDAATAPAGRYELTVATAG